jgi:Domain of unknown function (DUF4136)
MKTLKILALLVALLLASCQAIQINSDYDKTVDFSKYKTYAYFKNGIDKVEISDLDKKRILRSIDAQMEAKGFIKSENPDMLINIFTKTREEVNVNQFNAGWGYGWGFGWNPWMWGGGMGMGTTVSTNTEGTLFIDFIDATKKEMFWQGEGQGTLTKRMEKKDENINEFVTKILSQFPPTQKK